jgi:hypothetical protein
VTAVPNFRRTQPISTFVWIQALLALGCFVVCAIVLGDVTELYGAGPHSVGDASSKGLLGLGLAVLGGVSLINPALKFVARAYEFTRSQDNSALGVPLRYLAADLLERNEHYAEAYEAFAAAAQDGEADFLPYSRMMTIASVHLGDPTLVQRTYEEGSERLVDFTKLARLLRSYREASSLVEQAHNAASQNAP